MNQELQLIANQLSQATTPEDVFGEIKAQYDEMFLVLQRNFRAIAKITHPDMYHTLSEQVLAQRTFNLLTDWLEKAKEKIRLGEYGQKNTPPTTILRTRKREYSVGGVYAEQQIFNLYSCRFTEYGRVESASLKIVRDPHHNDLAEREVRILQKLSRGKDAEKFSPYLPNLLDAFVYESSGLSRKGLIFEKLDGWYSLEEVHQAYPDGIDPKDMAWIWRRLLVVLGFAHSNHVIHGAVLPGNICILPEEHGLMLINWHHAVLDPAIVEERIKFISDEDRKWYPPEILNRKLASFGTDIQMSATCMAWLLGGDPKNKTFPKSVPTPIKAFLKGCILPGNRAPQKAWYLKEEFDELIGRLWGERKFHPFIMK